MHYLQTNLIGKTRKIIPSRYSLDDAACEA